MKYFLLIVLLQLSIKSQSQNEFNSLDMSVTKSDLEINTFSKDSTANAIMLFESGKSYLDKNNFMLKTEVSKKLKILNRQGFGKAEINIYLYKNGSKKEKISNISATTYNLENNSVTKSQLDLKQVFEEKYNDNYTIIKFTFPNLKENSVITYSYTLESPFMYKYKDWYFQDDIPKLYSEYRASIPANYDYHIKLVGFLKLDVNDARIENNCLEIGNGASAGCVNYTYAMKDIPAFVEEDFMTTKLNYLARVEYELKTFKGFDGSVNHYTKSWKTVDSELKTDKNIGRQLSRNGIVKDLLDASIVNEPDPLNKARAIYSFVQKTYTWNNKYDIFNDVSVNNLIDTKSGNVSEINMLLHNLLDENGFDVKPVLLSTRNNGFVTKVYPVLSDFNYLIVQATIDGNSYLLDATDDYLSFGELPPRCLNQDGRLLDFRNGSSWIDIKLENTYSVMYRSDLSLNIDGILKGNVEKKSTGYQALPLKKAYFENKQAYIEGLNDKTEDLSIMDYFTSIEDKTDFEFKENFTIQQKMEFIGDNIYLNPFIFKFFAENVFKLQERTYPIDFGYKDSYTFAMKLTIDEGLEVLDQPKESTLKLPNNKGSIIFTSKIENNVMLLYFKLAFNDSLYNPEYYSSIKEFMGNAVDIQNNSLLVLKKK
ncbi:DUF3857 domain-containing protein [Subsaxibacter sp. CAU 1640]|uniref:DUF3857 domain-containing protein n=1 Tax=Subsaxibacter sp. CAU 1640 TaxID=2933271 RepID=UPI002004FB89|nr:DUF3857 domain-containing protein [Subsaxibacter sp. CAU 1640]MCK7590822.1 DUF3857 domain-containing protein [Subsaxibacter sp. CAU 1640]